MAGHDDCEVRPERSGGSQIASRAAASALVSHDLERELLALLERAHASAFNSGNMDEDVGAAIVWDDEAEAFVLIEELYGSRGHVSFPFNEE